MTTYITDGRVYHDAGEFEPGTEVDGDLFSPADLARLRADGFLKLPEELKAPQVLADERAQLGATVAAQQAELETLRAQLAAAQEAASAKVGKKAQE